MKRTSTKLLLILFATMAALSPLSYAKAGPNLTSVNGNVDPTTAIVRSDPNPIGDNVLDFQVTFSDPVTGVDPTDFTLTTTGSVTNGAISVSQLNPQTYNVTVINVAGTGTARLDLKSGTDVQDLGGNSIAGFNAGEIYDVDQTGPTVMSINIAGTSPTNATSVSYTLTFSEPVEGVSADDFTVVKNGTTGSVSSVTGSGDTYTVTVGSVSGNGTIRLDLNNGTGITDLVGNAISGGFNGGQSYTIDTVIPNLTSGSYFSNNSSSIQYAKVGDNLTLSVGYNEVLQSLTMTIGGNTVSVTPTNGGKNGVGVYTVSSSDTEGNVPWTISATDRAGNVRNYTNTDFGTVLIFDKTPPTPNISAPSQTVYGTGGAPGTVTYTVNYSDANLNYTTLAESDITLNATGSATGTVSLSGSGNTYTVTISNITGPGTLGISIAAGTAQDIPGNVALAAGPSATFNVASGNAVLTKLAVDPTIKMSQVTGPNYRDYTSRVGYSVSSVKLTPISVGDNTMTVTINGTPVALGTASADIPLSVGENTITTVVTAQDGITQKTYSLIISRLPQSTLVTFSTIPRVALHTVSGANFRDYAAEVTNSVSSIAIIPNTPDATSTIQVNGVTVASGSSSAAIPLTVGTNTITTKVTDGSATNFYSLVVTRKGPELSSFAVSPNIKLKTVAGPDYKDYTASVLNSISSISIIPTAADPNSTITVNGVTVASAASSNPIELNVGDNTINTVVTSEDGTVSYTYSLKVSRQAAAVLSRLTFSPTIPVSAVNGPDFKNYTSRVGNSISSVMVTPLTSDPGNTIQINGVIVASGNASDPIALNVGDNIITVNVSNGSVTNTYTTKITRLAPAILTTLTLNPKLALKAVAGPAFKNYTATAPNETSSITITPKAGDASNVIKVNGVVVASGSESSDITLNVGENTITTTVSDGVITNVYSIVITRQEAPAFRMAYAQVKETSRELIPVTVHANLSPNGDGNADHLQIDGITSYPENRLQIMNRNGSVVYDVKGYDNQNKFFDGHSKSGKLQQAGTYFYSLEYKAGNETKLKTGYIILKY